MGVIIIKIIERKADETKVVELSKKYNICERQIKRIVK